MTFAVYLTAQDIKITSFERNYSKLYGSTNPLYDNQGNACAVICFFVRDNNIEIEPNLGSLKREDKVGEVRLWVPKGTKRLTIRKQGLIPLAGYEIPVMIESKVTYDAVIEIQERVERFQLPQNVVEDLNSINPSAIRSFNKERTDWYNKCTQTLVQCYDSIYPRTYTSNYGKAIGMLEKIESFLENDEDASSMRTTPEYILLNNIEYYYMTANSIEIKDLDSSFEKEIKAWDILQNALTDFCISVVEIDWFDGSGMELASLDTRKTINEARVKDLKRVLQMYKQDYPEKLYSSEGIDNITKTQLAFSLEKFKLAVEDIASSITKVDDAKDFIVEDRIKAYESFYKKVQDYRKPLIDAMENWLKERDKTPKCSSGMEMAARNKYHEITAEMLNDLTECIKKSHEN